MATARRRFRSLLIPVLVVVTASLVSTPAMAGKKKAKQNPDVGGIYIPSGPVKRRGIVLENLDLSSGAAEQAKLASNDSAGNEPVPPTHHTPPIENMRLHALFDWN